jgi:hypothetical protein
MDAMVSAHARQTLQSEEESPDVPVALDSSNPRRPFAVWLIFLFYLLASAWTALGLALIYMGMIPLNESQRTYFANLTIFDHATTAILAAINIAAVIFLFRLRKTAIPLMAVALALNSALTVRTVLNSNWTTAIGGPGLVGASAG